MKKVKIKQENEDRPQSFSFGFGPAKVSLKNMDTKTLCKCGAIAVGCFGIGYGIKYLFEKFQTRDKAGLYRANAETDVWKAKTMKEFHNEYQPGDNQQNEQDDGSAHAFENDEPLPPVGQEENSDLDIENNRLFDRIIHRGEIGMLFGPKGNGKSIVSYWIALNIAEGKHICVWNDVEKNNAVPHTKVLYYDLELSPSDIHSRFEKYGYKFPDNFIRHDKTQIKSSNDIIHDLRVNIKQTSGGEELFVVIDNIRKALDITCGPIVRNFMKSLEEVVKDAMVKGVMLTVLIVNHPTKDFKHGDSLELADAAGSTELRDFLNYAFAIEPTNISKQHKILKVLTLRGEPEPEDIAIVKFENKTPYVHPAVLCEMDEKKALNIDKKQFEAYPEGPTSNTLTTDKRKRNRTGLTDEDEHEIYRLNKEKGISPEQLAKDFGPKCKRGKVSDTTIRNIIERVGKELAQQEQQGT